MTKSRLRAVAPKSIAPSKPKILIYGKPGVGKTWASLDFPSVYYIDTEGGATREHYTDKLKAAGGVYFGVEQGSLDFKEVIEQVKALATESHGFKTLVIDSFTKLYLVACAEAAEKGGDDFGRDRKEANKPTKSLINWLGKLDMNVILICHEKAEWGVDSKGQRAEIGRTFDGYEKLEYELDLCMNIRKQGESRVAHVKKSRLTAFPDGSLMPWSYADFAQRYGKEVMEADSKPIELATPEQLAEFNALLEVIKLAEGQTDKWLTAANANSFVEMDTEKMTKLINHLKEKKNAVSA
jgi:hypothetical protein